MQPVVFVATLPCTLLNDSIAAYRLHWDPAPYLCAFFHNGFFHISNLSNLFPLLLAPRILVNQLLFLFFSLTFFINSPVNDPAPSGLLKQEQRPLLNKRHPVSLVQLRNHSPIWL